MMSLGDRYAVICSAAIPTAAERSRVLESLRARVRRDRDFAGPDGRALLRQYLAASQPAERAAHRDVARAEKGFTPEQRRRLAAYGKIVSVDLETIETIGGGSARCMLAEVFLPRGGRETG